MRRHTALISALIVASLALTGCAAATKTVTADAPAAAASPTATPSAPKLAIGTPFEVKQNNGVAKITIMSATYTQSTGDSFSTPPQNGGFLILDVLWEAASGTASANPLYIATKDSAGRAGEARIISKNALSSGDVPVGDKMRGNVVFDIGAGPYTVVVTNQILQEAARLSNVTAS